MLGHSQTKERATGNPNLSLHHRATSRLYPVSCPFCMTMIGDGIKAKDAEDKVAALDVMKMIERSLI